MYKHDTCNNISRVLGFSAVTIPRLENCLDTQDRFMRELDSYRGIHAGACPTRCSHSVSSDTSRSPFLRTSLATQTGMSCSCEYLLTTTSKQPSPHSSADSPAAPFPAPSQESHVLVVGIALCREICKNRASKQVSLREDVGSSGGLEPSGRACS